MVIDLKQRYLEILEIIKSEKQRAEKDFESEITLFNKQLSEDFGKTIKVLLEWKLNHQKALSLGYNKLSSYISKNALKLKVVGETEAFEKFFIVCEGLGYVSRDNVFEVKRLRQEAYEAIKAEKFYQALGFSIEHINNNGNTSIKLPVKDDFETGIVKALIKDSTSYKVNYKRLEEYYTSKNEIAQQNLKDQIIGYQKQIEELQAKARDLELSVSKLTMSNQKYEVYNSLLLAEVSRKDFVPVVQFNELYWGDNYPSLKVLFDFLQKMNMVDFNWSYFANLMCKDNKDVFNLNSGQLNKADVGYLLYCLQRFYISDYSTSKDKYRTFLKENIYIDNAPIDDDYIKKYVRSYNRGKDPLKNRLEIDVLCQNIADKYH